MNQNYLLIGTAGHVDHGKTQLIHALTGISTDRLKEEKERGISIELGFAHLNLPDGKKAGIVDVPGHERFIRQMLAGASGMDVVLLVIAADEGVMPQTQEHLDILQLLQVDRGIIVITKVDLVDEEWILMVEEEIKEKLKNSFLENAPICKVSSTTHKGIPELLHAISEILDKSEKRKTDMPARMPIDRIFTIQGFGTVVTGTLNSGSFEKGQDITIEPGGHTAKVRNIQIHGDQVTQVLAGQRAAINLSGSSVRDIERGMNLVAPGHFYTGHILDVELTNLGSEKRVIQQRQRVHIYLGTSENLGRIHLLDREELLPGETAFAQVILENPVVAAFGDRFVIRYYSPVTTIGGGTIIGIAATKRKRFKPKELEELRVRIQGSTCDRIKKKLSFPITVKELEKTAGLAMQEIQQGLEELMSNAELIVLTEDNIPLYWTKEAAESWGIQASAEAAQYQKQYPLRVGLGREELKNKLRVKLSNKRWSLMLEWGAENAFFRVTGNLIEALPEIKMPDKIEKQIDSLIEQWKRSGLNLPDMNEVELYSHIDKERFDEIAGYLVTKGIWTRIGEHYYAIAALDKAKIILKEYLGEKGQVTVSEARDLFQTSRKHALPVLEYFDSIRFTKREDTIRRLF